MDKYLKNHFAELRKEFHAEVEGATVEHYGGTMLFYFPSASIEEIVPEQVSRDAGESDLPCLLV